MPHVVFFFFLLSSVSLKFCDILQSCSNSLVLVVCVCALFLVLTSAVCLQISTFCLRKKTL